MNPLQASITGNYDVFVSKINPSGTALVYSTYLGGSSADLGYGIAVDSMGNAYITGSTCSTDFPTKNPLQPNYGGGNDPYCADAFVTKINAAGSALVYSTYLGGSGSDEGSGIAVDSAGHAYVTGGTQSTDFPTMNPLQPGLLGYRDAFVAKINAAGSALLYSTYLGGSSGDGGEAIAVDSAGHAYVVGYTDSTGFPTKNPLQPAYGGNVDAFVAKINAGGSALLYSTYLGGSDGDQGSGIAVDGAGNAYVTGTAGRDFPTVNPLQPAYGGAADAFVAKINTVGSALVYSTYLGGSGAEQGIGIAVDSAGSAHVTGWTYSADFPLAGTLQKYYRGRGDAFVARFNPTGSAFVYSTYLGGYRTDVGIGIAVDSAGNAYVTGGTSSTNFPTMNPLQPSNQGGVDAFVAKIYIAAVTTTTLSSSPNPSAYGQAVTFTAALTSSLGAPPDGETVTFMKGTKVLGTGALSGGSASFTTSALTEVTNYIKAMYDGDSKFAGSTSYQINQVVSKATTTTTLASSQNPSNFGQSVTFAASVAPQFGGTVKGTVTFYDGTTALKTAYLSEGVAKFTTSTLTSGTHSITATYNGNASFTGSSASLTQTVN